MQKGGFGSYFPVKPSWDCALLPFAEPPPKGCSSGGSSTSSPPPGSAHPAPAGHRQAELQGAALCLPGTKTTAALFDLILPQLSTSNSAHTALVHLPFLCIWLSQWPAGCFGLLFIFIYKKVFFVRARAIPTQTTTTPLLLLLSLQGNNSATFQLKNKVIPGVPCCAPSHIISPRCIFPRSSHSQLGPSCSCCPGSCWHCEHVAHASLAPWPPQLLFQGWEWDLSDQQGELFLRNGFLLKPTCRNTTKVGLHLRQSFLLVLLPSLFWASQLTVQLCPPSAKIMHFL